MLECLPILSSQFLVLHKLGMMAYAWNSSTRRQEEDEESQASLSYRVTDPESLLWHLVCVFPSGGYYT